MDYTIREARREDMQQVLELIKELAEHENHLEDVDVTIADLEQEGFDNGNFKQKDETTKTMGMKIVEMMNKQLKGSLEITNAPNFNLTLLFPSHE